MKVHTDKINFSDAHSLVTNFHYLGKTRFICRYPYGLFIDDQLVGAVVYQPLAVPNSAMSAFGLPRGNYDYLVEMGRLVLNPDYNGKNYGSMLISRSIKYLKAQNIKAVISYADSSRHLGAVYQAANFKYYGLTAPKKDYLMPDGKIKQRGLTKNLGGSWIPRTQKHRYLYLIDKTLPIKWVEQSYPKEK